MHSDELDRNKSAAKFVAPPSNEEEPVGEPFYLEEGIEGVIIDQIAQSGGNEAGGFIVNVNGRDLVIPMQNDLLTSDKPGRARYGYEAPPLEIKFLLDWMQAKGGRIIAAYHTGPHPGAKLSGGDHSHFATHKDKPFLANAAQIVFDAENGQMKEKAAYRWNPVANRYSRAPLLMKQ